MVFYITSIVYAVGTVVYWFWCSGELQPWAKESLKKNNADVVKSDSKNNS